MASAVAVKKPNSLAAVLLVSLKKAWTVGSAGFIAGTMQVFAFMWLRTTMNYQTDGDKGMKILRDKVAKGGPLVLWQGWEGNYIANVVGGYPWFAVMNYLSQRVPVPKGNVQKLIRSAFLGACASSISDLVSNSIRVIKTKKQTHENAHITYMQATREIVDKDGVYGILFRGLETRILTNVLQGAFFTVVWKSLSGAK